MDMAEYVEIHLICVPGHKDIEEKCIAVQLARKDTFAALKSERTDV